MQLNTSKLIGLAAAAIVIASVPAMAQGKGHDDRDHGKDDHGRDRQVVVSNGEVGRVPPGLAKKSGGLPPGQFKKRYTPVEGAGYLRDAFVRHGYTVVRTTPYGSSQYVYYRAPNGTLQRAIVRPGTSQLGFTNVPSLIANEVLSRLR